MSWQGGNNLIMKVYEKICLYGDERFMLDVNYVCYDLAQNVIMANTNNSVQYYISDGYIIVFCFYDDLKSFELISKYELKENRDYILLDDFLSQMDDIFPENREIALYGCGYKANQIGPIDAVSVYIDKNPNINEFMGKLVLHPDQIDDWKKYNIIITLGDKYKKEVAEELTSLYGLHEEKDFFYYDSIMFCDMPSLLMKKVIYARPYKGFKCLQGINEMDFCSDGHINPCCSNLTDIHVGNMIEDKSVAESIDSYWGRIFKLSLINCTFVFCNSKCASIECYRKKIEYGDLKLVLGNYDLGKEPYPQIVKIGIDGRCNLKCETCRDSYHIYSEIELKKLDRLKQKIKDEVMDNADTILLAGNGEVFASPVYKYLLENEEQKPRNNIVFKSNGNLFDNKMWKKIENAGYKGISFHISIDAASKKTYEEIRRGGDWEKLTLAMELLSKLRCEKKIQELAIFFVVQQKNYLEMKEFIELGHKWNCDYVHFARIENWGTYDWGTFNESITLFTNNGLGIIRDEYLDFFDDDIFDEPIVSGIKIFRCI